MIKKAILGTAAVVGLIAVVWGTRPFSYAKTWVAEKRQEAEDSIPIDLKIKNAREEIEKLGPETRRCMYVIAEQQTDLEHLEKRIETRTADLEKQKLAILALREKLAGGETQFVYAGRSHNEAELKRDLGHWFDQYKVAEAALNRENKVLLSRKKALEANERKLDEMLAARKDLELALEELIAHHEELKAAKVSSTLEFDDSQVSKARARLTKIKRQLDIEERMLNGDGRFVGEIPIDVSPELPKDVNVIEEIDAHFRGDAPEAADEVAAAAGPRS